MKILNKTSESKINLKVLMTVYFEEEFYLKCIMDYVQCVDFIS